jgi:Capsular polysaccharide synthesis protein
MDQPGASSNGSASNDGLDRRPSAPVWMYWENAPGQRKPPYLELCLDTIKAHLDGEMRLHLLDAQSVSDWLPDLEHRLWNRLGTPVRRSDYARVRLVERYGGVWLDADCMAVASLRPLVDLLAVHDVVGWGADVGDRFYNNLFGARAGSPLLQSWIEAQDAVLAATVDWDLLPWAALGQDLMRGRLTGSGCYSIPSRRVAPVLWYEWRRLLSPVQSPARVLASAPMTVMLWNSAMQHRLAPLSAASLLGSKMLIGRLFRIALGTSRLADEMDLTTRLSSLSNVRFSATGRRVEGRIRATAGLRP